MKHSILLFAACLSLSMSAQSTKTVEPSQGGTLFSFFSEMEKESVLTLTVKGKIDARDFAFMRDELRQLTTLNMQLASIVTYTGTLGTSTGELRTYPANEIPAFAFYNPVLQTYKPGLSSVTLPVTAGSIGTQAFYFCWNLGSINIPNNLKKIEDYAFYGCYALSSFSALTTHSRYSTDANGILYNKNKDTLFLCPNAKTGSITLPASVRHIDKSAFENCYNLSSVSLPASLQSTGSYAFANCAGISGNLNLPTSLTNLGDGTFYGCYNLTGTVSIPAALVNLGSYCFFESYFIQSFNVHTSNNRFSSVDGMLYCKNTDTLFICPPAKTGTIQLPSTLKLIGSHAFYGCSQLSGTLSIPASTDYIGYYAFNGCNAIQAYEVAAGNSWFKADNGTLLSKNSDRLLACPTNFSGPFTLPDQLLSIDPGAFGNCTSLSGLLVLPATLSWIGEYAFYNCPGLAGFEAHTNNPWYSTIDGVLLNKAADTLYICPLSKQGDYTLPSGVRHIGAAAFSGCININSFNSQTGLHSLDYAAFSGCTNLKSVNLPPTITRIGNSAFYACGKLNTFSIAQPQPPLIGYYTFELANQPAAQLIVPTGSLQSYRNAPYWQNFTTISEQTFNTQLATITPNPLQIALVNNCLHISGLSTENTFEIHTTDGRLLHKQVLTTPELQLPFQAKGIFIITNGNYSRKIVL
jgi:hypothetical protein